MSYRQSNAKKQKTLKGVFFSVIILALIILTPIGNFIEKGIQRVATPFWIAGDTVSTRTSSLSKSFVSDKEALVKRNIELEEELRVIGLKLLDRNLIFEENLKLQEELGRDVYGDRTIAGRVLSSPGTSTYDTLIIDIGTRDSVATGDLVFVGGSVMVGSVTEAFSNTSRVQLSSSPGSELDVLVSGNVEATAKGRGGGNFTIELPRDVDVFVGDTIETGGSYMGIIGLVEYIEVDPNDPFQKIFLKSPINVFDISWVEVLRKN